MKKKWIGTWVLAVLIGTGFLGFTSARADENGVRSGTIEVRRHTEAEFPGLAKIDFAQAVRAALEKVKGNVLKAELEDENGFLVYGVEVVTPEKAITDVKVDAGSGKVLAMDRDQVDHEKGARQEERENREREDED